MPSSILPAYCQRHRHLEGPTYRQDTKSIVNSVSSKPPTFEQLWRHFLNAAVPMVGFGFIDNFIMLQAGEYLDTSICVTFGLSTLTAAAVGQIFSDVSGGK